MGKVRFISHLDDNRESSMIGIRDAAVLLVKLTTVLTDIDHMDTFSMLQKWAEDTKKALTEMQDALVELGELLDDLRTNVGFLGSHLFVFFNTTSLFADIYIHRQRSKLTCNKLVLWDCLLY